ncbi:hypothetical protein TVAG_495810 [Trichomonas vaginalis G3]|uniref:Uncharacterized protein n=1 Tax=Trichomonas vaginalis (strain ATCC PRA-98 / G3) TaxID=412133 RepID=A2DVM0_TRIV3|nr:spectrin binding [Trichomonas vaginalis G3]EAY15562.1 hypothetical protein TVAG_495810 [Trichomonas vaginalis G3]KAI5526208.1 spectrin binding [Trichomonas vaginalis G3]|eukprot:XP_001327785.1 hypothetical protein [Trichomonas vaginalis G3]
MDAHYQLDRDLLNLTSSNVNDIVVHLSYTVYLEKEKLMYRFVDTLVTRIPIRVQSIDSYATLIHFFAVKSTKFTFKEKFKSYLLDKIFEKPYIDFIYNKIPLFATLRQCIKLKVFANEEIRTRALEDFSFTSQYSLLKALFFLPEIESQQCNDILSNFVSIAFKRSNLGINAQFLESHIQNLTENNYSLLLECIHSGSFYNDIANSIKNDDINQLIHLTNITEFDINGRVQDNLFEHGLLCHSNPTYISYSCFYGSLKCFKFLLLNNADMNITDDQNGFCPEHYAIMGGNAEIIRIVNQRRFDTRCTLQLAVLFYREDVFEWLLNTRKISVKNDDENFGNVVHMCSISNNFRALQHCITLGAEINDQGLDSLTPLQLAICFNSKECIQLLLNTKTINLNTINKKQHTALHVASMTGNCFAIKKMRKKECNPNISDANNWTALHFAISTNNYKCVKALLKFSDIDLSKKTIIGETPMLLAMHYGNKEIIDLFVKLNVLDPNDKSNSGVSALHIAFSQGLTDIIKYFLSLQNCDVNIANSMGQTPIFECVSHGYVEGLKILMSRNDVDVMKKDIFGQTIFTIPKLVENEEIVSILKNYALEHKIKI